MSVHSNRGGALVTGGARGLGLEIAKRFSAAATASNSPTSTATPPNAPRLGLAPA